MRRTEESKLKSLIAEAVALSLNEAPGEGRAGRIERLANMMLAKSRRGLSREMLSAFVADLGPSDKRFYDENAREIIRAYSDIRVGSQGEEFSSAAPRAEGDPVAYEPEGGAVEGQEGENVDKETMRFLKQRKEAEAAYLAANPEAAIKAAKAAEIEMGTRVRRARPESILLSPAEEKGRVGQFPGRMPSVGISHNHLEQIVENDPVYEARRDAVRHLAAVNSHHVDPTRIMKQALYSDATLLSQVPSSLSASIIRDMVITTAVADMLERDLKKSASNMPTIPGLVTSSGANKFANDMVNAYTRLAQMQDEDATDEVIMKEAEDLHTKSRGDVVDVLSDIADYYYPSQSSSIQANPKPGEEYTSKKRNPQDVKLLFLRLKHQSDELRPHLQRLGASERKIRRLTGGGSVTEVETMPVTGRDPVTGKRQTTDIFAGVKTRSVAGGILIPRALIGDEPEGETPGLSVAEEAVFEQMASTKFKLTQARGFYLVARACEILKYRNRVETFYRNKNMTRIADDLTAVFDGLDQVVSAHPSGKLGIRDVKAAMSAIRDVMSSGETAGGEAAAPAPERPPLVMSDKALQAAERIRPLASSDSKVASSLDKIISAATEGGFLERADLEDVFGWMSDNFRAQQSGALLFNAISDAIELEGDEFAVSAAEGSTRVKSADIDEEGASASAPEDKSFRTEGNEADNAMLQEAIDNILGSETAWQTVQAGMYEIEKNLVVPSAAWRGGQRHLAEIRAAMKRHLEDPQGGNVHVSERIRRAIGTRKSLLEVVDGATRSLNALVSKVKADQAEAYRQGFAIKERNERSPHRSAAINVALKAAYAASAMPMNMFRAVEQRITTARTIRSESTPSRVFLTPFNALQGASQTVAEQGFKDDLTYIPPSNNGSPYAIPMGPATGTGTITGKDKKEALENLFNRIDGLYTYMLGDFVSPGSVVVIPSMMRTPNTENVLTLGLGRVVYRDVHSIVLTDSIISSLPEDMRKPLKRGMQVNLMSVTVSFPAGQWRIGKQSYDIRNKREMQKEIARLVTELESMSSASDSDREAKRQEILRQQHKLNLTVPVNASKVRATLTRTDSALTSLFVNDNVALDEASGVLTLSNIAPAFLDNPSRHETERAVYAWPSNTQLSERSLRDAQSLETLSYGEHIYVPASAVQIKPEHLAETASPFNINQVPNREGARFITYRVGNQNKARSFSLTSSSFKFAELADEARVYAGKINVALRQIEESVGIGKRILAQPSGLGLTDKTDSHPITITIPGGVSQEQVDQIRTAVETVSGFMRDYYLLGRSEEAARRLSRGAPGSDPGFTLIYELRAGRRSKVNRITSFSTRGGEIGVGDMVYIAPMYEAASLQTTSLRTAGLSAANNSMPPELYGVGKVTRIYFHGTSGGNEAMDIDSSNPAEVRALLADIEFRGDQVKTNCVRGSMKSPSVALNGVGVAFLSKARMRTIDRLDPDRTVSSDPEQNYPDRSQELDDPYVLAGWHLPSPADRSERSAPATSSMTVGSRCRIVQTNHPSVGMVGTLSGFLGSSQLTQGQRSTAAGGDISPTQVNAIVTVAGANLIGAIRVVLDDLADSVIGKPYTSGAIRELFRHIDRDITLRYIRNPRGARGYAAFNAGTWNVPEAAKVVGPGAERGYIEDRVGTRRINNRTVPEHGSGAWAAFHAAGNAVHPGSEAFGKLTGRRVEVKPIARPGQANTLYGCNAILSAILQHGPEKTMSAEESYEAERHLFTAEQSSNIAGSYDKTARDPYASGLHTDEAQYFQHLKAVWLMAGGGKSGRSTEGAQNQYYGYGIDRVGSPVGTSFRFQLSDSPTDGGLEYTLLLRREMRSVLDVVQTACQDIKDLIGAAEKPGAQVDAETIRSAKSILSGLEKSVRDPIQTGINFVSNLGYEDAEGKKVNTLDVWLKAKEELDRGAYSVKHDFSPDIREAIKRIRDQIWSLHAHEGEDGERIFGVAPLPGAAKVEVGHGGRIIVTFSNPIPAHRPESRTRWASVQTAVIDSISEIISSSVLRITGSAPRPESVEVIEDAPRARAVKRIMSDAKNRVRTRTLSDSSLTAWESEVLSHKSLGEIISQDAIDDLLGQEPGQGLVTGFPGRIMGTSTAKGSETVILKEDNAYSDFFGRVEFAYDQHFIDSEQRFITEIEQFAQRTLVPALQELENLLKNAPEDQVNPRLASKILAAVESYHSQMSPDALKQFLELAEDRRTRNSAMTKSSFVAKIQGLEDRTPDAVARKAAELCHSLEIAFRDVSQIANEGFVVERGIPSDKESVIQVMQDSHVANERSALENMGGFPSASGVATVISELRKLQRASSSTRIDQVCVPIKSDNMRALLPLLRLRPGQDIPPDAQGELLNSIEPA